MAKAGRKSHREELQILRRYSDLTEPYFKVIKKHLESNNVEDQRWAAEQLKNAFVKMIPQEVSSDNPMMPFTLVIKPSDGQA
jgi:hypothetical protein